ncbi:MAG: SIS domain-containing protein [Planctomycetes bacterium]|nr:SIS domain-containing protein [Planctomycetota bacterium]
MNWREMVQSYGAGLSAMEATDGGGRPVPVDEAFRAWSAASCAVRSSGRCAYLIGNGASASMASHAAADVAKNGALRTQVFTDLSLITAIGNDIGYAEVFAEPLRRHASRGDLLVAISSSGRSENVLRGARAVREAHGTVVTLSAMRPDNPLRSLGDINLYVPVATYGLAESCHAAVLHHWIDAMVDGAPSKGGA